MTQEDLAEKMGVSRQTVSKWELDAASPEMDKARLLFWLEDQMKKKIVTCKTYDIRRMLTKPALFVTKV